MGTGFSKSNTYVMYPILVVTSRFIKLVTTYFALDYLSCHCQLLLINHYQQQQQLKKLGILCMLPRHLVTILGSSYAKGLKPEQHCSLKPREKEGSLHTGLIP